MMRSSLFIFTYVQITLLTIAVSMAFHDSWWSGSVAFEGAANLIVVIGMAISKWGRF